MSWTWIITILSIVGVVLNIKKKKICFLIWIVTNTSWMIIDYLEGLYSQSALFLVYLILAFYGLIEWNRKKEKENCKNGD